MRFWPIISLCCCCFFVYGQTTPDFQEHMKQYRDADSHRKEIYHQLTRALAAKRFLVTSTVLTPSEQHKKEIFQQLVKAQRDKHAKERTTIEPIINVNIKHKEEEKNSNYSTTASPGFIRSRKERLAEIKRRLQAAKVLRSQNSENITNSAVSEHLKEFRALSKTDAISKNISCENCPKLLMENTLEMKSMCKNERKITDNFGMKMGSAPKMDEAPKECAQKFECEQAYTIVRWLDFPICDIFTPEGPDTNFSFTCNGTHWLLHGFPIEAVACAVKTDDFFKTNHI